jgi:hypothetical protein
VDAALLHGHVDIRYPNLDRAAASIVRAGLSQRTNGISAPDHEAD